MFRSSHIIQLIYVFIIFSHIQCFAFGKNLPDNFAALDNYLQSQFDAAGVPGGALVVVSKDKMLHMRGFGISGPDQRACTPRTLFLIGSTSKSFTALGIMQLVEAGKLELDAPVSRYLPWFRTSDSVASEQITVRHLLNQTSGFSTFEGLKDFANTDTSDEAVEKRLRALQYLQLGSAPGKHFEYSNINYVILGYLIQVVSGQSYSQYMKGHVFAPLAMRSSAATDKRSEATDLATGYRYWFGKSIPATSLPYPKILIPAGYLYTNAEDMGHYLMAHMSGGMFEGKSVLSSNGIDVLHSSSVPFGSRLRYAMGWIADTQDPRLYDHDGGLPHFASYMAIAPEEDWAVAILVNANSMFSERSIAAIGSQAVRILRGKAPIALERDKFFPAVLMGLFALFVIELIIATWMIRRIRKWHAHPELSPKNRCRWLLNAFVPLLSGSLPLLTIFIVLPVFENFYLPDLLMFAPDAGFLIMLNLVVALVGGATCAYLTLAHFRHRDVDAISIA